MRAEADQRSAFLYESRESDFANLSVGNRLSCLRVKNLGVNKVVKNVHALCLLCTVDSDSGTVTFGKAVNVVKFDSQNRFDSLAHFFAPTLRADYALLKLDVLSDSASLNLLGD